MINDLCKAMHFNGSEIRMFLKTLKPVKQRNMVLLAFYKNCFIVTRWSRKLDRSPVCVVRKPLLEIMIDAAVVAFHLLNT